MKKLLCLSALIVYIFACCPCSTTSPPTPTATVQPSPAPPEPTDTPQPPPAPTETPFPTDTPQLPPTDTPAPSGRVQAQVVNVIDGDTIEVSIEGQTFKLRYIGIDTPETKHPDEPIEPFGPEAAAKNEELVGGKVVELEKDVSETDQYGRLLRYVYVGDLMVNAELVRLGFAQVSTYPPDVKYQDLFLQLQQEAREAERGLWGAPPEPAPMPTDTPVPPAPSPGEAQVIIVAVDKRAEYVDIQNIGGAPQDLTGWHLLSERGSQDCLLGGVIQPGETLRVWAMAEDADKGGYNCGYGGPIWNNSERDPAVLYDATGQEVSRK